MPRRGEPFATRVRCSSRFGVAALTGLATLSLSCAAAPRRPSTGETDAIIEIVRLEAEGAAANAEVFREAMRSEAPAVRARATRAFARTVRGRERELQPFVTLLASDADAAVRREAAFALGLLRDEAAVPFLKAGAGDVEPLVRATALDALSLMMGGDAAWFADRGTDSSPLVRREAVLAAAKSRDASLCRRLEDLLAREKDERVRWAIYWALSRVGSGSPETRKQLLAAIGDPNFLVAVYALEGLKSSDGVDGASEILAVARAEKPVWIVKEAAVRTLAAYLERQGLAATDRAAIDGFLAGRRPRKEQGTTAFSATGSEQSFPEVAQALRPLLVRSLRNPRAEVRIAGRGSILLELFVVDAPLHVAAFVELARVGHFNGRRIESSDPLEGVLFTGAPAPSGSLEGAALRDEAFPSSCLRGSVLSKGGIAGSMFIAQMPLPGVDGVATCWGKVDLGMEVLDLVAAGDVIESVTVLDSTGLPLSTREANGS